MSAPVRAGRLMVGLYPLAWRRRYAEEMLALLEQHPPSTRDVVDLLRGATRAHLRLPAGLSTLVSPAERMRNSIGAMALCWGVLDLAGAGFAKDTEDPPFAHAAGAHALLGVLHGAVTGFALAGALVVAVAGAPLLAWVLATTWRGRRRELLVPLLALPAALGGFVAITAVLLAMGAGPLAPALQIGWVALVLGVGLLWAGAPRIVLTRLDAPAALLTWAMRLTGALSAMMVAIGLSTAAYAAALVASAPAVAGGGGGPPLFANTGEALVVEATVMVLAAAAATLSGVRGRRALARR